MSADEQAIRELIQTWLQASTAGDPEQVAKLMAEDVVFLTAGQKPFGKDAFVAAFRAGLGKVRIDAASEVQEIQISGALAYCWNRLQVTVTPVEGGDPRRLAGNVLSILRKQPGGNWVICRDANLLTAEVPAAGPGRRPGIQAAVPVFRVSSVARSIAWYREVLGFTADPFGPSDNPSFAILRRDGVELMLMRSSGAAGEVRSSARASEGWDAYIRVTDVHGFRAVIQRHVADVGPITRKEYGCQELVLADPDGHVLVISQCG
jgi:uncharacterized protein (TIGR02246 family)